MHNNNNNKQGRDANNSSSSSLTIGGEKGHVIETITGPLLELFQSPLLQWKPIPRCTGRYTIICRDHHSFIVSNKTPRQILLHVGIAPLYEKELEFDLPGRRDKVLVLPLDEKNCTGIITYVKKPATTTTTTTTTTTDDDDDNDDCRELDDEETMTVRYVHTLNTPSGFRRKLEAMGFTVSDSNITFTTKMDSRLAE